MRRLRGENGGEIENKAPQGPSRHFPQRGKIFKLLIFPLWGKYRQSRGRRTFLYPNTLKDANPELSGFATGRRR